jgi:hypothetical protein
VLEGLAPPPSGPSLLEAILLVIQCRTRAIGCSRNHPRRAATSGLRIPLPNRAPSLQGTPSRLVSVGTRISWPVRRCLKRMASEVQIHSARFITR